MTKIYYVRHGESQANKTGILAGGSDSPITKDGIRQAEQEAAEIKRRGLKIDTIIASPLSRAVDTATIIAKLIDFPVESIKIIDSLREKSSGSYEGRPSHEMFEASEEEHGAAGGETLVEFADRVVESDRLVKEQASGTTIVVGHAEWYRMAICLKNNWSPLDMIKVDRPLNATILEYPEI